MIMALENQAKPKKKQKNTNQQNNTKTHITTILYIMDFDICVYDIQGYIASSKLLFNDSVTPKAKVS